MMKTEELDPWVALADQIPAARGESVTLAILFTVEPADTDTFVAAWAEDAGWSRTQPGFLTAQLHRGVSSSTFLDIAVFETAAALEAMTRQPEFARLRGVYPSSTVGRLHLFRRVAVPGICLGEAVRGGSPDVG